MTDVRIDYDKAGQRCTVTVSFDVPEAAPGGQLDKPELQANVIEQHLLTQSLQRALYPVAQSLLTAVPHAIESNVQGNPALDD